MAGAGISGRIGTRSISRANGLSGRDNTRSGQARSRVWYAVDHRAGLAVQFRRMARVVAWRIDPGNIADGSAVGSEESRIVFRRSTGVR